MLAERLGIQIVAKVDEVAIDQYGFMFGVTVDAAKIEGLRQDEAFTGEQPHSTPLILPMSLTRSAGGNCVDVGSSTRHSRVFLIGRRSEDQGCQLSRSG